MLLDFEKFISENKQKEFFEELKKQNENLKSEILNDIFFHSILYENEDFTKSIKDSLYVHNPDFVPSVDYENFLMRISKNLELHKMEMMLSCFDSLVNRQDENGYSPLMYVIYGANDLKMDEKSAEAAKLLFKFGADLELPDQDEKTPLMLASEKLNLPMMNFLLSKGVDVHRQDKWGNTALIYAMRNDLVEEKYVKPLLEYDSQIHHENNQKITPFSLSDEKEPIRILFLNTIELRIKFKGKRRYVVKGYASSPGWSGCTFAHACGTLDSAKKCFEKKKSQFEESVVNADAILLIDRRDQKVLAAVGSSDPEKTANYCNYSAG
jgi:hypothetical protein